MDSIAVLITVWKRSYLEEQLDHLIHQTVAPQKIWILQNEKHLDLAPVLKKFSSCSTDIVTIVSDQNLKFFGRFSIATHIDSRYLLVIDDDVIPGRQWLELCLEVSNFYNAIVSCTGRLIQPGNFKPEEIHPSLYKQFFIGDNQRAEEYNYCSDHTFVDYGCNSYFFRTEWLRYFWSIWPCTFLSGEDIHLSSSLKVSRGIPTIVPAQDSRDVCGNLKRCYSLDELSSWRQKDFFSIREKIFYYMILEKGWKPILWD
jgi:GT2 family glycosyltransferase